MSTRSTGNHDRGRSSARGQGQDPLRRLYRSVTPGYGVIFGEMGYSVCFAGGDRGVP